MVRYRVIRKARNGMPYTKAWKYDSHLRYLSRSISCTCMTYGIGTNVFDICGINIERHEMVTNHDGTTFLTWVPVGIDVAVASMSKKAGEYLKAIYEIDGYNLNLFEDKTGA